MNLKIDLGGVAFCQLVIVRTIAKKGIVTSVCSRFKNTSCYKTGHNTRHRCDESQKRRRGAKYVFQSTRKRGALHFCILASYLLTVLGILKECLSFG
jgi:hypothetical protein